MLKIPELLISPTREIPVSRSVKTITQPAMRLCPPDWPEMDPLIVEVPYSGSLLLFESLSELPELPHPVAAKAETKNMNKKSITTRSGPCILMVSDGSSLSKFP